MDATEREKLIHYYLAAYNRMDVHAMLEVLDDQILFENYSAGQKTLVLNGLDEFRNQAEEALEYFSERKQVVEHFTHRKEESEIQISYWAITGKDFPNGIKKGEKLELKGKSIFKFTDSKISEITDYS